MGIMGHLRLIVVYAATRKCKLVSQHLRAMGRTFLHHGLGIRETLLASVRDPMAFASLEIHHLIRVHTVSTFE